MAVLTFFRRYWPSAVVLCVILYATLADSPAGADALPKVPHIDKLIHAVMMGGLVGSLTFDTARAFPNREALTSRRMLAIALGVMLFGVLDELAQSFLTAERSGDPFDLFADWVGVWVAYFTAPGAVRRVLRRK